MIGPDRNQRHHPRIHGDYLHIQIHVCPFHGSTNRRQARTHDRLGTFELILSNDPVRIETEGGSSESRTTKTIMSPRMTILHRDGTYRP